MVETITIKEALKAMHCKTPKGDPIPFSVSFVTSNTVKKTGGEIIELSDVVIHKREKTNQIINAQVNKRPNHKRHRTINFWLAGPQRYMKAHIDLLLYFNHKWIIW